MKCPKCQSDNPETATFCADCGTKITSPKDIGVTKTIITPATGLQKGSTIAGKYRILEELGRGGMGIVYNAKDTKLKRNVALKVLPAEMMQDKQAKARFFQEAQAAAALNHPNICIIHEVDEADDQTFIVMEFIEGQTLTDRIAFGKLEIDEAVKIVTLIGEGLDEAHTKGIVHRDIKPANIMLTDKGTAKIMDFGIVKVAEGVDLTKPSTLIGTVAYMSPEQARGEEVDHRTDIWSLGAMFYEMLTGERPFKKQQEHALIYEILNNEPPALSTFRSDVPDNIERAILKTLTKNADQRYANIQSFIQDLKPAISIDLPKTSCSIVVLPFDDMSPNKDNEYFSDGLTEEIITDLSQIKDLCVISRNSAMALKGTKKNTKTIGKELNVQYVLEGSVRKAGNNIRITAQLIDARSDIHLWAKKYNGNLDDVFEIQEKVSRFIVDSLKLPLSPEASKKIAEHPIDNVQAHECHLRARREMLRTTEDGLKRALQDLQSGLEIVGENALLYADMAMVYNWYIETGIKADEESLLKAEEFAQKVAQLSPDSWYSHHLKGLITRFRGSSLQALKHFKRALSINPNIPDALMYLSIGYAWHAGKFNAAKILVKRLLEIDPLTPLNYICEGIIYLFDSQFDRALSAMEKMIQMEPGSPYPYIWRQYIFVFNEQHDKVIELIDQFVQNKDIAPPGGNWIEWALFLKYALQGKKKKAFDSVSKKTFDWAWHDPDIPAIWAGHFAFLNEKEKALDWLERGVDRGCINYPMIAEKYPLLDNIRGEDRFKKLMERVKHEWENFEV